MKKSIGNQERVYEDIVVIGYVDGLAILEDEWNTLFYFEIPAEFVTFGEVSMDWDIQPISKLSEEEQKKIIQVISAD